MRAHLDDSADVLAPERSLDNRIDRLCDVLQDMPSVRYEDAHDGQSACLTLVEDAQACGHIANPPLSALFWLCHQAATVESPR